MGETVHLKIVLYINLYPNALAIPKMCYLFRKLFRIFFGAQPELKASLLGGVGGRTWPPTARKQVEPGFPRGHKPGLQH